MGDADDSQELWRVAPTFVDINRGDSARVGIAMELMIDGIKYAIDIGQTDHGFSVTWSCPVCQASGRVGMSDAVREDVVQVAYDKVRKHHADKHAKP